jgi:hypothetical protein
MITIFCDFAIFWRRKWRFFSKNNAMIIFFAKNSSSFSKNADLAHMAIKK